MLTRKDDIDAHALSRQGWTISAVRAGGVFASFAPYSVRRVRRYGVHRVVSDDDARVAVAGAAPGVRGVGSHGTRRTAPSVIASIPTPGRRALPDGVPPVLLARRLLTALTWGLGAGFPEEEWTTIGTVLCAGLGVGAVGAQDVSWVLEHLGRYVVQDGEAGVAVYRVAHQSLADHLRAPFVSAPERLFDPEALPIVRALLDRYRGLLDAGIHATGPGYLWRYAWRHAALAGLGGLALLRELAASCQELRPDVAMAALSVAATLGEWGTEMRRWPRPRRR